MSDLQDICGALAVLAYAGSFAAFMWPVVVFYMGKGA